MKLIYFILFYGFGFPLSLFISHYEQLVVGR